MHDELIRKTEMLFIKKKKSLIFIQDFEGF